MIYSPDVKSKPPQNMGTRNTFSGTLIKTMVCQGHLAKKGQAKVEIIIPNPVVIKSSPLLPLSLEKNGCSGYNNFNECHLFFSENLWIWNNNFNFSLSLFGSK